MRIVRRSERPVSPWVTLIERDVVDDSGHALGAFHSLAQADYVNVLAETSAGEIVLVEQFRPAREAVTIELPGGLVDPGETPLACALRELREEVGYAAPAPPVLLGKLIPDTGRLDNWCWYFHATGVEPVGGWHPESELRRILVPKQEFLKDVREGRFLHALHIAAVTLAMLQGRF
jgi:8-oxo-dGTP pyrophosphatase MutT (NUDIX family)